MLQEPRHLAEEQLRFSVGWSLLPELSLIRWHATKQPAP
jgi:hypothetical protein